MPLITQIERGGKLLPVKWGDFHVCAMVLAACFDSQAWDKLTSPAQVYDAPPSEFDDYPATPLPITPAVSFMVCSYPFIGKTPLNAGSYTLTGMHSFRDTSDGEIFTLLPGDVLSAYRG